VAPSLREPIVVSKGLATDEARADESRPNEAGRAEGTRQTILATAMHCFAKNGYAKTTMVEVAEQAGTSVGLLYYHFRSKEALFYSVWNDCQSQQQSNLRDVIRRAQHDGIDGNIQLLLIGAEAYAHGAWANRLVYRMAYLKDRPPGFTEESALLNERWTRRNQRLTEAADPHLAHAMSVSVTALLGGLCRAVVICDSEADATLLIDRSMSLLQALAAEFEALRDRTGS
jgi:AcrR family transcriptional regulator